MGLQDSMHRKFSEIDPSTHYSSSSKEEEVQQGGDGGLLGSDTNALVFSLVL